MSDKTKAVAKELIPALEAAGFTVEAHEQSWRTRYNIHHLDKHIGTVDVSQKYTFDPVNIRVEAAGWEPTDRYNLRNWQKNPYSHYRWVGRNYRKIDSVVKALVASLETIPGDEERVYAKAVEKATSIYNDRHRVDSGLRDINIDLLRYDLDGEQSAEELRPLVTRGIAYHHAGMLPTLKEVVERLFTVAPREGSRAA